MFFYYIEDSGKQPKSQLISIKRQVIKPA